MTDPSPSALGPGDPAPDFMLPAADVEGNVVIAACLRSMQNSRKVEVHRTGAKVKKQAYQFPEGSFPNLGGLPLVPERVLVTGDRQYGAITACDRYLGLLADMLKYIDTKSKATS
jgi:hypothetical protein